MGKSKVKRCSIYEKLGRLHVKLNGESFEAVDC